MVVGMRLAQVAPRIEGLAIDHDQLEQADLAGLAGFDRQALGVGEVDPLSLTSEVCGRIARADPMNGARRIRHGCKAMQRTLVAAIAFWPAVQERIGSVRQEK